MIGGVEGGEGDSNEKNDEEDDFVVSLWNRIFATRPNDEKKK